MTKENFLFAIIGVLLGAIIGFFFANSINQSAAVPGGTLAQQQPAGLPGGHPAIPGANGGSIPEVQAAIEKARQDPKDFEAQMKAAELFYQIQRFDGAIEFLKNANAIQPVYGDLGWAGLRYSKNAGVVTDWINFFGQKENFTSFMQVLQYYPTQTDAKLTGPVPEAEAPLLKKTAVSQVRLTLPGMTFDNNWGELLLSDQYTPESFAAYYQKNWEDSRPQWQKYIGMFDDEWAKLYFG